MTLLPHVHRLRSWFLLRPRFWAWIGSLFLVLVAVRVALPFVICRAINSRLAEVEGYRGEIRDVDLQLFRGAYRIDHIDIRTLVDGREEPFFSAETVDFSIAWKDLFDGRLVSDIFVDAPRMIVTRTATPADPSEEGRRWQDVIEDIFPIEITHFEISRGTFRFVDDTSAPRVDVTLSDLHILTTGLRNTPTPDSNPFPAVLSAQANTLGGGRLELFVQADPLAAQPRFQLKLDLKEVDLTALNDFLEAYANVDVSAGTFQLYLEVNAADGAFDGYLKPFADHVEFENLSDKSKGPLRRFWEAIVSGVTSIVENEERQQIGTRIPFSGEFGSTEVGIWPTIANLVRHGFGRALFEGLDGEPPPTQETLPSPDNPTNE